MRARLALAALLGLLSLLILGGHTALAGPPPAYFVTVGVTGGDIGFVPFSMEQIYARPAAAEGASDLLDDILAPAAVADPKFGCNFSVPGHPGFPACTP